MPDWNRRKLCFGAICGPINQSHQRLIVCHILVWLWQWLIVYNFEDWLIKYHFAGWLWPTGFSPWTAMSALFHRSRSSPTGRISNKTKNNSANKHIRPRSTNFKIQIKMKPQSGFFVSSKKITFYLAGMEHQSSLTSVMQLGSLEKLVAELRCASHFYITLLRHHFYTFQDHNNAKSAAMQIFKRRKTLMF